MREAKLSKAKS